MRRLHAFGRVTLAGVLLCAVAACGGDDDVDDAANASTTSSSSASSGEPDTEVCEEEKTKPVVEVPDTKPTELVVEDLEVGSGPEATAGKAIGVQYVGVSFSTRQEFDASWTSGQPFVFVLGEDRVIPGWDQGVEGMKLCGRRLLVIPPELGYGAEGAGPVAPNETLVFVVDLVGVEVPGK